MWVRLSWRLSAGAGYAAGAVAALAVEAVVRFAWLHWLPRRALVPVERILIAAWGRGLFDTAHYLARNPDVAREGGDALGHYLVFGWRENRPPNRYFDDDTYRSQSGLTCRTPISPLAHFLAIGRGQGLAPVPAADAESLTRTLPALEVARMDGYSGLVSGAVPSPDEGRPVLSEVLSSLATLPEREVGCPEIDVVVPVYGGRAETLNALIHAIRARNRIASELVVVDDATPDAALAADLDGLAERGLITLLRNPHNLGFPGSINRGMALNPARDVIWLNADTEVYDGWIDRLHVAAHSRPRVATVTPLTNCGTVCSYPSPDHDNFGELEIPWDEVDRLTVGVNAGETVETPTAVGFATYVRREALDAVGELDADTFGRGYGEENDFCQRARKAGWVNLIAADVFVRHFGATSFQGSRAPRVAAAMQVMDRLHPEYRRNVEAFVARDPLGPARCRLDLARLRHGGAGRAVLMVTHTRGGGTAQHVQEEVARLRTEGRTVYTLTGGAGSPGAARLARPGMGPLPGLAALDLDDERLWEILAALNLERADIHHLIDFPETAPETFRRRFKQMSLGYEFVVHDYFAVCPRINMADGQGRYCGEPPGSGCGRCLLRRGSVAGRPDIDTWRAHYGAFLRQAVRVRVPDEDVARRLRRYFPGLAMETVPHDQVIPGRRRLPLAGAKLRIAVVGAIGGIKGFDSLLRLARYVQARGLPVQLTVIGYTHNDLAARAAGIEVTGAYTNDRVQELIQAVDPHLVWIPSLWPETYCYTLSIALGSGRAVAAFDLGAQAGRLRRVGCGRVLPLEDAFRPERLLGHLRAAAGFTAPLSIRAA